LLSGPAVLAGRVGVWICEDQSGPHGYYPEDSPQGRQLLDEAGLEPGHVVLQLYRGQVLVDPTNAELATTLVSGVAELRGGRLIGGHR
jgi:hypothetical protein